MKEKAGGNGPDYHPPPLRKKPIIEAPASEPPSSRTMPSPPPLPPDSHHRKNSRTSSKSIPPHTTNARIAAECISLIPSSTPVWPPETPPTDPVRRDWRLGDLLGPRLAQRPPSLGFLLPRIFLVRLSLLRRLDLQARVSGSARRWLLGRLAHHVGGWAGGGLCGAPGWVLRAAELGREESSRA